VTVAQDGSALGLRFVDHREVVSLEPPVACIICEQDLTDWAEGRLLRATQTDLLISSGGRSIVLSARGALVRQRELRDFAAAVAPVLSGAPPTIEHRNDRRLRIAAPGTRYAVGESAD
jgi:hypothetical protein